MENGKTPANPIALFHGHITEGTKEWHASWWRTTQSGDVAHEEIRATSVFDTRQEAADWIEERAHVLGFGKIQWHADGKSPTDQGEGAISASAMRRAPA